VETGKQKSFTEQSLSKYAQALGVSVADLYLLQAEMKLLYVNTVVVTHILEMDLFKSGDS
jgi:hypothetical protein